MARVASIDIGSHTARLLIAETVEPPRLYHSLAREREYIRLARGFNRESGWLLENRAIGRTVEVLEKFVSIIEQYQVDYISAAATGVVRRALNRRDLLESIYKRTGINARVISGEEEARLTDLGVAGSPDAAREGRIIFDLGGGSTEFIFSRGDQRELRSIPLGAMILTQEFLSVDPPSEQRLSDLTKKIDRIIGKGLSCKPGYKNAPVIGTGGTVTTLAAMAGRVETWDISHGRLDQTILELDRVVSMFEKLKRLDVGERSRITGLDPGRAEVILAGTLAVMKILEFLDSRELVVSLSGMLEGLIIDHLKEN